MSNVYGVGVANRYAALMDDDEVATSTSHGKGGKENKDNSAKGKIAPGKANTAATGAPSNKQQQQPQAATKSASSANNIGNKSAPGSKPHQQQQKNAAKGGKADSVNNNSIHAVNNNQVNPGKSPRNQPPAAVNDLAKAAGQASEEQRQPRLDHRGQARQPRHDRPPRQQTADSHGNGPQKDSDEARKNRRNREDRGPLQPSSNFTGEANVEGSGEGRPNRGPRNPKFFKGDRPPRTGGPRGPRSFGSDNRDGRGKPVFDRHSGSDKAGIKPVEKRDGAGAHNWGTYTDELEGQVASEETRPEKTATDESNEQGEAHTDGEVEPAKEAEEEGPKEMTLEEYRKQLGGQKRQQPKFKLRKPGEGEDNAQWKKTYLLKKDEEEEELEEIEEIEVLKEETRHSKKKVIDIDIRFNNTFTRGGDDRGRRGGGGGGGGGGGRPGGRPGGPERKRTQANVGVGGTSHRKQAAPKVDDINDFPSLGVAA